VKEFVSWKQVFINIAALFSGNALARGLSAATLVVIARQVGPEAFGQYSGSMALVGLATVLFSLGLDGWLLYQGGRNQAQLNVWFTSSLSLKTLLGAVWLAGLWGAAPYLNQSSFPVVLIYFGSLSLWMEEIAMVIWSAFKACLRNDLTFVLMTGFQGLCLGITIWLAGHHIQEPGDYLRGRALAALLGVGVSGFVAAQKIGLRLRLDTFRSTLRGTSPFAASIAISMVYGRADLAIVASELGKAAAGVYGPAITLTNALFLIPASIYGVMVPLLSRGYAEGHAWVSRLSMRLILATALLGVVLGGSLAWVSRSLIPLIFGASYQASGDVLAILGGVLVFRCPNMALAAVLVAVNWQVPRVGVQFVSAVLNVLLNFMIIHQFGVMGVARVYVLTEAVLFLGSLGMFVLWMRKERVLPYLEKSC
jgi:O-antigen/teichoic acid export membrane protein